MACLAITTPGRLPSRCGSYRVAGPLLRCRAEKFEGRQVVKKQQELESSGFTPHESQALVEFASYIVEPLATASDLTSFKETTTTKLDSIQGSVNFVGFFAAVALLLQFVQLLAPREALAALRGPVFNFIVSNILKLFGQGA